MIDLRYTEDYKGHHKGPDWIMHMNTVKDRLANFYLLDMAGTRDSRAWHTNLKLFGGKSSPSEGFVKPLKLRQNLAAITAPHYNLLCAIIRIESEFVERIPSMGPIEHIFIYPAIKAAERTILV